jgi:hypothetical protein
MQLAKSSRLVQLISPQQYFCFYYSDLPEMLILFANIVMEAVLRNI